MTNSDTPKVESEGIGKFRCYKYIAINIALIGLLLVYTELFIGETVLDQMVVLGLTIVIAFIPLINTFFNTTKLLNQGSTLLAFIMCFILYYLRIKLILFSVYNNALLTKEDGRIVLRSISPNGIALILNSSASELDLILKEVSTEFGNNEVVINDFTSIKEAGPVKIKIPTELESKTISKVYERLRLGKSGQVYVSSIKFKNPNDAFKYSQILGKAKEPTKSENESE
ncbi:uncharacterized protein VICG_02079 [Vittaforma corneae ATCC 50505]|uniref:Uncharacterized protein n=1 Tax=Vittaforma corneae (strain ATCC 50505) TaxID=993615 RepID=L2GJ21_VITCO|nr:uncharacterized protein VICG_02079 [Vittaforma corneae ATCC 50505]ELA40883.1 hypothetical protein VICG_02079 [Vittaforma corneae ATCC 50505]